ncbi:hypothetical protein WH47_04221 [Habropoda laboriosa]|uniref:Uncharacterized protein n=1 Tax=Habropoda laboriosa TaxID=597456 RepID=A0A0L7QVA0_9HYME|nr:hypothetical protein WH47_04221 [Habropoda laboriosa]
MSLSPVANRSFLHGDQKAFPTGESPDKIIYATLDSLALKRATLPLQLLPVHNNNVTTEGTKGLTNADADARRSSLKSISTDNNDIGVTLIRVEAKAEDRETPVIRETMKIERDFDNCHSTNDDIRGCSSCKREKESPWDNYERIESVGGRNAWWDVRKERKRKECDTSLENEEKSLCSTDALVKSKSSSDTRLADCDEGYLIETFSEEELPERLFSNENLKCGKKKKHFAKNVLHFVVPEYLVKGPKRRQKKKSNLSVSLSSLKASSIDSNLGARVNCNSRYRSRSLSREEFKFLKISSPTNFVHVASATNPSLILNKRTVGLNLEQVVITHEEKCATLPLLVATNNSMAGNQTTGECSIAKTERMSFFNVSSSVSDKTAKEEGSFDFTSVKRELLSKLDTPFSVKTLESSQQVKTSKYGGNIREGKTTYKPAVRESTVVSLPAELHTNSSFLWSNRSNSYSENTRYEQMQSILSHENPEDVDVAEEYDDVGPLNLIVQEDNYDDVGTPVSHSDGSCINQLSTAFEDFDSIYDGVMAPCNMENVFVRNQTEMYEKESKQENDSHLSENNQYSSVDENTDDTQDNDQDVYDDVGLPSQERVNSLYAGSTTGSILGSTSANGKESEWEDLEESTTISLSYHADKDAKVDLSM